MKSDEMDRNPVIFELRAKLCWNVSPRSESTLCA